MKGEMSIRQAAKVLGVSHTLLVLWKQGKRNLTTELEARYHQLVTTVTMNGYNKAGYTPLLATPESRRDHLRGAVAQLGEHLLCKQGVRGSSPLSSTSYLGQS